MVSQQLLKALHGRHVPWICNAESLVDSGDSVCNASLRQWIQPGGCTLEMIDQ